MKLHKPERLEGVIRELELRFTPSGRTVSSVWIGLTDGTVIPCEAWGALAELLVTQYDRGSVIVVTGSYKERHWTDPATDEIRTVKIFGISEILK